MCGAAKKYNEKTKKVRVNVLQVSRMQMSENSVGLAPGHSIRSIAAESSWSDSSRKLKMNERVRVAKSTLHSATVS